MVPKVAALARSWTQYGAKSDQDDAVWREIAPKLRSYRDFEAIVAPSGRGDIAVLGVLVVLRRFCGAQSSCGCGGDVL